MADRSVSRRRLLALSGAGVLSTLSGCASVFKQANGEATQTTTRVDASETQTTANSTTETETQESVEKHPKTITEPRFDLPAKPLPKSTPEPRYPTLGTADTTITIFGNWKCPYTQEFVRQQLSGLVDEFVVSGDVSIEYRNVSYMNGEPYLGEDAPTAAEGGLAVWDIDPSSFWTYFAHVFANQPQERFEWATTDTLTRFAEEVDADGVEQIQQAIRSRTYSQSVHQSAARAEEIGITTVPRVVFDDEVTAPTVRPEATRKQFERAANNGPMFGDGSETDTESTTTDTSGDETNESTTTTEDGSYSGTTTVTTLSSSES